MAEINDTSSTGADADAAEMHELAQMAINLNAFGALLVGVSQICCAEEIGGDALHVAATICAQINTSITGMADRLDALAKNGGAA